MSHAPVAFFVYRRPEHTRLALDALAAAEGAENTELFVFSDAARTPDVSLDVAEVRRVVRAAHGFARIEIVERESNLGLARSIRDGVGRLVQTHGVAIVLEDDLVVARGFLSFMNAALGRYAEDSRVMQVCGFMFPVAHPEHLPEAFFLPQTTSWGWATWRRAWSHFRDDPLALLRAIDARPDAAAFDLHGAYSYRDMLRAHAEGRVDSWAVLWYASVFLHNGLCLWPQRTLVSNRGLDGSGTHGGVTEAFASRLWESMRFQLPDTLVANDEAQCRIAAYLRAASPSRLRRLTAAFTRADRIARQG